MTDAYTDHYYTASDGLRLHYRNYAPNSSKIQGLSLSDVPTYLCMPGLTRNANDFISIAEALSAAGKRVICAEQRGRGDSDWDSNKENYIPQVYVDDMFTLIDGPLKEVKNLYAVGTSLGGLMSIMMNAMRKGVFQAIAINDMGMEIDPKGLDRIKAYVGKGGPISTWAQAIEEVKAANASVYPDYNEAEWDHFTRLLYVEKNGVPMANYDPAISETLVSDTDTAAPSLWPLMDSLKQVPVVVLRGELSDILCATVAEKMVAEHGRLQLVTVPNVGHCPTFDSTEEQQAIIALSE